MHRVMLSMLLMTSMVLAGCFGSGESMAEEPTQEPIWTTYALIDSAPHDDARMFVTIDLATNQTTNTSWAVFDKTKGGNCCEHYIATSIEGQILNIGANTQCTQRTVPTHGTRTFQGSSQTLNAEHSCQPTRAKKGLEREASSKQPTAISSRCHGIHMLAAI